MKAVKPPVSVPLHVSLILPLSICKAEMICGFAVPLISHLLFVSPKLDPSLQLKDVTSLHRGIEAMCCWGGK